MSEKEKKEFCYPIFKEDVKSVVKFTVGCIMGICVFYACFWYIPIEVGKYVVGSDTCTGWGNSWECDNNDYWDEGIIPSFLGYVTIFFIGLVLHGSYKKYWITEEECYKKDGKRGGRL